MRPFARATETSPLFDEIAKISVIDPQSRAVLAVVPAACCIMPLGEQSAFDGSHASTSIARFSLLVARFGRNAWNRPSPPKIGDRVQLCDGRTFAVTAVNPMADIWHELELREC